MKPTRALELIAAALVTGVLAFLLLVWTYRNLPKLPRTGPLSVLVIALLELQTANLTRHRLAGRPGTKPIMPITVARLAALAKASSLTAAVLAGAWGGLVVYTAAHLNAYGTAGADLITASLGLGSAVALVVAAILLERVCRVRR